MPPEEILSKRGLHIIWYEVVDRSADNSFGDVANRFEDLRERLRVVSALNRFADLRNIRREFLYTGLVLMLLHLLLKS